MNKIIFSIKTIVCAALLFSLSSCNNVNDAATPNLSATFDYQIDEIVGIWESSLMLNDSTGEWHAVDGSDSNYSIFSFKIRFNDDYTYSLDGYISNESGTYTASKSVVATYVGGSLQAEYDISKLSSDQMELTLVRGTDATDYVLTKRW